MGVLRGQSVHYRASSSAGSCHAMTITDGDNVSTGVVNGVQVDRGLVPALVPTAHTSVGRDDLDENGTALGTSGTWHYPSSCPD